MNTMLLLITEVLDLRLKKSELFLKNYEPFMDRFAH
jgi:hypothetical protein